ncbi:MAG: hypothetical protein M3P93_02735 [Actinomycetota bacterium]|nr:hypothetical protein [Actinomycetota bacterium]
MPDLLPLLLAAGGGDVSLPEAQAPVATDGRGGSCEPDRGLDGTGQPGAAEQPAPVGTHDEAAEPVAPQAEVLQSDEPVEPVERVEGDEADEADEADMGALGQRAGANLMHSTDAGRDQGSPAAEQDQQAPGAVVPAVTEDDLAELAALLAGPAASSAPSAPGAVPVPAQKSSPERTSARSGASSSGGDGGGAGCPAPTAHTTRPSAPATPSRCCWPAAASGWPPTCSRAPARTARVSSFSVSCLAVTHEASRGGSSTSGTDTALVRQEPELHHTRGLTRLAVRTFDEGVLRAIAVAHDLPLDPGQPGEAQHLAGPEPGVEAQGAREPPWRRGPDPRRRSGRP